jgi:hypothetical protein
VNKGRRAVTHTDEHRANHTPVRNQFQELLEHQEDSLVPRKLIVKFTGLQAGEGIPPTDPSDSSSNDDDDNSNDGSSSSENNNSDIQEAEASDTGSINNSSNNNESSEDNNTDISENDHTDTGSFGSTKSFDTMTAITSDYASLLETI